MLLRPRDEAPVDAAHVTARLAAVRAVAEDPRAEVLVAGRTSAAHAGVARAAHRGPRPGAGSKSAGCEPRRDWRSARRRPGRDARAPTSVLGIVVDEAGPGALGDLLARLCDAAIVDTRVLLAHRLGADETGWPSAEDRFASDLLLSERVVDPWLRELTASAAAAPIPILLGGHTLVGPGMRLVIGRRGARGPSWT